MVEGNCCFLHLSCAHRCQQDFLYPHVSSGAGSKESEASAAWLFPVGLREEKKSEAENGDLGQKAEVSSGHPGLIFVSSGIFLLSFVSRAGYAFPV